MIKTFNLKSQLSFVHRLGVLLSTGISLLESLEMIKGMEKDKKKIKIYSVLIENISKGLTLADILTRKSIAFDSSLVSVIYNGEISGTLAVSLIKVYEDMQRREEVKKKVVSSLIYPIFIFITTIAMTLFLVMFIFPKIFPLLNSLNITLPFLTRAVSALYLYIIKYGIITGISLFIFFIIFMYLYKKSKYIKEAFERIIFTIPFIGEIFKKYIISNHFHSIALLLDHGQPLSSILDFDSKSHKNNLYRQALFACKESVLKGISFGDSMNKIPNIFPKMAKDMVKIGERTGNLSNMLSHTAKIYEGDVENFVKRLSVTLEPLLMIFMGIMVGSIALSIILPIYEITNHLQK